MGPFDKVTTEGEASKETGTWNDGDEAILEKIRRRALSMVSGLKGVTYEEKLPEVIPPTLEERRHQADMVQTFKIVKCSVADPDPGLGTFLTPGSGIRNPGSGTGESQC